MFWRKRKPQMDPQAAPLVQLAGRLGVERRYAPRVSYPEHDCRLLPAIFFDSQLMRTHDISTGGCCLIDPAELLGPGVGSDVHLILRFYDGSISVHGRIVSRVDHKRHIQFLNLPKSRIDELQLAISFGSLGQNLRPAMKALADGPRISAREMWSSTQGDSVIIEDHVHRLATITLKNIRYMLYKHAWPIKDESTAISPLELARLIIFLCNIPHPSELLAALIAHVETMTPHDSDRGER